MLKTSFFKFSFRKLKSKYEIILGWSFDVRDCFLCVQRFLEVEVGFCCFQAQKTCKKSIFQTFCNFSRTMNYLNPKLFFLELWYQKGCFGKRKKIRFFHECLAIFDFLGKWLLRNDPYAWSHQTSKFHHQALFVSTIFLHLHSLCVHIVFNSTGLGIHSCKTSQPCNFKMRLGGEIWWSDVNMH